MARQVVAEAAEVEVAGKIKRIFAFREFEFSVVIATSDAWYRDI